MRRPSCWTHAIRVGKYRGHTLKEIFDKDPKYLRWAIDNGLVNPAEEVETEVQKKLKEC